MRNCVRLTEKRLSDRRFRRTEEAILRVYFEGDNFVSIEGIVKKVGVTRSTFYYHHRTVREIVPDYRRLIIRKYSVMMGGLIKGNARNLKIEVIYSRIMRFVIVNKKIFQILILAGERSVFREMIEKIKPVIMRKMRLPKSSGKMYRIYASEIVEVLEGWGRCGFDECMVEEAYRDILNLTKTMRARLDFLV